MREQSWLHSSAAKQCITNISHEGHDLIGDISNWALHLMLAFRTIGIISIANSKHPSSQENVDL